MGVSGSIRGFVDMRGSVWSTPRLEVANRGSWHAITIVRCRLRLKMPGRFDVDERMHTQVCRQVVPESHASHALQQIGERGQTTRDSVLLAFNDERLPPSKERRSARPITESKSVDLGVLVFTA